MRIGHLVQQYVFTDQLKQIGYNSNMGETD